MLVFASKSESLCSMSCSEVRFSNSDAISKSQDTNMFLYSIAMDMECFTKGGECKSTVSMDQLAEIFSRAISELKRPRFRFLCCHASRNFAFH